MNAMVRKLVQATAAFLLFGAAGFAQTGTLQGDVKGADGGPIVGAQVHFIRQEIKGNYFVKTDKKGHYLHAGLPLGTYKIILEVGGKEMDSVNGVKVNLGEMQPINFNMKAAEAEKQALAKTLDSGGKLTDDQARGMSKEQRAALEKSAKDRQAQLAKNAALNEAYNAGKDALAAKNYDAAVDSLLKATTLDQGQVVVWIALGDAYQGQAPTKPADEQAALWDKASDAYLKAIALEPTDASLHNNLGLLYAKAKKFDLAMAELNKAAELDPKEAGRAYFNLGAILTNAGQREPAGEAFKKSITADPTYAEAQYQYGIYLLGSAKTENGKLVPVDGTTEAFQKYLELTPTGPHATEAKGLLAEMNSTVETTYKDPNAKTAPAPKKKAK